MKKMNAGVVAALTIALANAGCGVGDALLDDGPVCEAGRLVWCPCVRGGPGTQQCDPEGRAWGPCQGCELEARGEGDGPPDGDGAVDVPDDGGEEVATGEGEGEGEREGGGEGNGGGEGQGEGEGEGEGGEGEGRGECLREAECGRAALCEPIPPAVACPSVSACHAVLVLAGLTVREAEHEEQRQHAYASAWLCDRRNGEQVREQAFTAAASGDMTLLDWIGLSANDTEQEQLQEVARWQQTTCSHDVQASSDEWIRDFLMTVEDNREVLSTWADCVREVVSAYDSCIRARSGQPRGLMILPDHEPGEGQFFTLNIRWCGVGGELLGGSAEVTGRLRVEGAECEEEGRYGQGCALCIGDGRLVCRRRGSSEVVASLTVEARSGNAARTYSASAWLPALCQPGTGRCSEDVLERCDDLRHWYFERECPDTCVEGACEPICDAGERRECRCADGSTGTQDCSVDGLSLSACDCYEVCDQQDNDGDGQTDEEVTGLDSDPANCGACFHVCAAQLTHTEGISCEAGVCSFGQCAAGFSDGDGDAGNGCELSCRERNLFRAEDLLCEHNRGSCSDVRGALDEDDATAYSCNTGRVQAPQGSVHCTLLAQREFDVPRHISAFEFHLMAYGADTGAYARDRHAEYGIYYRIVGDQADSWRPVDDGGRIPWDGGRPGGDGDLGNDSGFARIAVDLHDVTAVRVLASGSGNAAGGEGTAQGAAAFYRVAAFGEPCD